MTLLIALIANHICDPRKINGAEFGRTGLAEGFVYGGSNRHRYLSGVCGIDHKR